jgi:hypothetical protein
MKSANKIFIPMDNLLSLKEAIFNLRETNDLVLLCYNDLLDNYNPEQCCIFINLLEMLEKNEKIIEIMKVLDLIRFPVKKSL